MGVSLNECMDATIRLQRAWNSAVDDFIQLKCTRISINISSHIILFSYCYEFNTFAMKFTILLLHVLDILLSISISSLDLYLHSLPLIGTELNYSAPLPLSLVVGGVGWKHQRWGAPCWAAAHPLMPAAELSNPGTCSRKARQPAHWHWGSLHVFA